MEYIKLCDICDFQGGSQPPKNEWSSDLKEGYIRMLQIRDFTQNERVTPEYIKITKTTKICEVDDILIARYGASLGKILTGLAGAYNVAIMRAIPDENVLERRYLYYYLKSPIFQEFLLNVGSRAAQAGFNKNDLQDLLIPNISKREQLEIVGILERVESVIEIRKQELQNLDDLIKSRFFEMFGDPVENPYNWPVDNLTNFGECKNGMNFHTDDSGVEIHCLGVGDFKDLSLIEDTSKLPTISLNEMPSDDYLLTNGDIVFVRSNGNKALVGRSVVVYPDNIPTTFSGFCIRFRIKNPDILSSYLLRVLKTDSMRKKMAGRGANIQNLNQKILATLRIPIPALVLQEEFEFFVKKVDKSKLIIQKALNETQLLFESLLQEYFK